MSIIHIHILTVFLVDLWEKKTDIGELFKVDSSYIFSIGIICYYGSETRTQVSCQVFCMEIYLIVSVDA